jgi:hypothetical protein
MRQETRPQKKFKVDQVVELLSAMPRVRASEQGPYTYKDRAADFLAVFNGSSSAEQGQRVLAQIAQICDPTPLPNDADKPGTLAYKTGMRRVMTEIMVCMAVKEPVKAEKETQDVNEQ